MNVTGSKMCRNLDDKPTSRKIRNPSYLLSEYYDMGGKRIAKIFSHFKFNEDLKCENRVGNEMDEIHLKEALVSKGFDVQPYKDRTYKEIIDILRGIEDDESISCLIVVVMSHGRPNQVCAVDMLYNVSDLWEIFIGKLLSVPKLFFIQACRGQKTDPGVPHNWKTDGRLTIKEFNENCKLPLTADFLMMYSTYEDHKSFREYDGTWFIQSLIDVLKDVNNEHKDLLQLLTIVNRKVALDFASNSNNEQYDKKKQMPQIISMLTKLLKFD